MRKVKYKCGYCNSEFELSFFNEQEIPERNAGCTNCRMAGEKVTLINKIRDERAEREKIKKDKKKTVRGRKYEMIYGD